MLDNLMRKVMNKVVDTTYHFASPAIELSRKEMTDLIKNTKFTSMRVWSTKLNGARMRRMEQTRDKVPNSSPGVVKRRRTLRRQNMWVVYSQTDNGWRTIRLGTVDKVKINNQFYKIR
jgi:hypothetical protein|tara:strand:+ start:891 stop:1244 length:354 start_codon:yes stop_codon:yes gene_type:complete